MKDMDEDGFDTERIICHVTWSPKQQAFLVAVNTKHSTLSYLQVRHMLETFGCSMQWGILMKTESG